MGSWDVGVSGGVERTAKWSWEQEEDVIGEEYSVKRSLDVGARVEPRASQSELTLYGSSGITGVVTGNDIRITIYPGDDGRSSRSITLEPSLADSTLMVALGEVDGRCHAEISVLLFGIFCVTWEGERKECGGKDGVFGATLPVGEIAAPPASTSGTIHVPVVVGNERLPEADGDARLGHGFALDWPDQDRFTMALGFNLLPAT